MRLFLTITDEKRERFKEHLKMNGYSVEWETDNVIDVDEEELSYVKTILLDRYIPFTDDLTEQWFGDIKIKHKIDVIYNLAREVIDSSKDIGEYDDTEKEMLDEITNVVDIYEKIFNC